MKKATGRFLKPVPILSPGTIGFGANGDRRTAKIGV